jgi:hypothetical protein
LRKNEAISIYFGSAMKQNLSIERITMLWAISESVLVGILHALHSPFTGLVVGGLSIVFIALIAFQARALSQGNYLKTAGSVAQTILKSAVFVLLIKALVSPHSPIGAYVAVSVQALLGSLFFGVIPNHKIASLFTGLIATVSSAVQKILVLVIVFGTSFFQAIDEFVVSTAEKLMNLNWLPSFSSAMAIAIGFVCVYAIGGIIIGIIAGNFPKNLQNRSIEIQEIIGNIQIEHGDKHETKKKAWHLIAIYILLLIVAFILEYAFISEEASINQLIRTITIVASWVFILQPLFHWFVATVVKKNKIDLTQLEMIKQNIPKLAHFAKSAWKTSSSMKGFRINNFLLLLISYGLYES